MGFNAGVLYEFSPQTRMGVTYHPKSNSSWKVTPSCLVQALVLS